jgi:hypothetical protein
VGVHLDPFTVTLDWFPDALEDDLSELLRADVEAALAEALSDQVATLVSAALTGLAIDTSFSGVDVSADLDTLRCAEDGLRLTLNVSAAGTEVLDLSAGAGSLRTDAPGPSFPLVADDGPPFAVAADDDLINQLLFAVWAGGALHGISFSGAELVLLAGEIPPPLGPVERVDARVDLPPVVGAPTHEGATADLSLGELRMVVTREDGVVTDASLNVRTGASVRFTDEGALDLALDARPAYMTLEVGVEAWPQGLDPGDIAALFRLTTPPLLGTVAALFPAFDLPAFPLEGTVPGLDDAELRLASPNARMQDGWLVIDGSLAFE